MNNQSNIIIFQVFLLFTELEKQNKIDTISNDSQTTQSNKFSYFSLEI